MDELIKVVPIRRWEGPSVQETEDMLIREWTYTLRLNGAEMERGSCTPQYLSDLAVGRLYAGGLISTLSQVRHVTANLAEGTLDVEAALNQVQRPLQALQAIPWAPEAVMCTAGDFLEGSGLFHSTGSVHSMLLCDPNGGRCRREDISRHSVLYKAVGGALSQSLPLEQATLYTSGRFPASMAELAIRAGIPIVVTRAAPTDSAVAIAKRWNLTLAGFARRDRLNLYAGF